MIFDNRCPGVSMGTENLPFVGEDEGQVCDGFHDGFKIVW